MWMISTARRIDLLLVVDENFLNLRCYPVSIHLGMLLARRKRGGYSCSQVGGISVFFLSSLSDYHVIVNFALGISSLCFRSWCLLTIQGKS